MRSGMIPYCALREICAAARCSTFAGCAQGERVKRLHARALLPCQADTLPPGMGYAGSHASTVSTFRVHVRFRQLRTYHRMKLCRRSAKSRPEQVQQKLRYSMTSSAIAISDGGTSRPSALAVLRLSTSSNLVDCTTGRSAGFSPLRIRPT